MTTLSGIIERASGSFATSFLVWAKFRTYPECDGDGVFVGEVEIDADEDSVGFDWDTPNGSTDWKMIALPRYQQSVGLPGRIEAV